MRRLQTRPQFQAVLACATVARTAHFALHRFTFQASTESVPAVSLFVPVDAWLGALVPKRWAKRAVTRNTIRRQIYQLGADEAHAWPVAAHVVRLRARFDAARFRSATSDALKAAVHEELRLLFARAAARPAVPRAPLATANAVEASPGMSEPQPHSARGGAR